MQRIIDFAIGFVFIVLFSVLAASASAQPLHHGYHGQPLPRHAPVPMYTPPGHPQRYFVPPPPPPAYLQRRPHTVYKGPKHPPQGAYIVPGHPGYYAPVPVQPSVQLHFQYRH